MQVYSPKLATVNYNAVYRKKSKQYTYSNHGNFNIRLYF